MDSAEADEAQGAWQDWTLDGGAMAAQREHARTCKDCLRKLSSASRAAHTTDTLPWLLSMAAEASKQHALEEDEEAVADAAKGRAFLKDAQALVEASHAAGGSTATLLAPEAVAALLIEAALYCTVVRPPLGPGARPGNGNGNGGRNATRGGGGGSAAAARAQRRNAAAVVLAPPLRWLLAADAASALAGCQAARLGAALAACGHRDQRAVVAVLVALLREAQAASRSGKRGGNGRETERGSERESGSESDSESDSERERESESESGDDGDDGARVGRGGTSVDRNRGGGRKAAARAALAALSVAAVARCCDPFTAVELVVRRATAKGSANSSARIEDAARAEAATNAETAAAAGRLWANALAAEASWWQRRASQGPGGGAPVEFPALEAGRVIEGRRAREGGLRLEAWAVRSGCLCCRCSCRCSCCCCCQPACAPQERDARARAPLTMYITFGSLQK